LRLAKGEMLAQVSAICGRNGSFLNLVNRTWEPEKSKRRIYDSH